MSILSKNAIKQAIEDGKIIADGVTEEMISNQSIDVTLGQYIAVARYELTGDKMRSLHPNGTITEEFVWKPRFKWVDITEPIQILPGTCFLAYTEEFIGTTAKSGLHPEFQQGSTPARLFLFHPKAGWGDSGFFNRWAMEFQALQPIIIQKDNVTGQIRFARTEGESDYVDRGQYQKFRGLETLKKLWDKKNILAKKLKLKK